MEWCWHVYELVIHNLQQIKSNELTLRWDIMQYNVKVMKWTHDGLLARGCICVSASISRHVELLSMFLFSTEILVFLPRDRTLQNQHKTLRCWYAYNVRACVCVCKTRAHYIISIKLIWNFLIQIIFFFIKNFDVAWVCGWWDLEGAGNKAKCQHVDSNCGVGVLCGSHLESMGGCWRCKLYTVRHMLLPLPFRFGWML